jgi:hypothetical protein
MNWRDPKKELPYQGQRVWVMLQPHKERGSLLESAMSIQIVCGEAFYPSTDPKSLEIQNWDELGQDAIGWSFEESEFIVNFTLLSIMMEKKKKLQ